MFNSLFWMFKQEDFKKHFIYLFSTCMIFLVLASVILFIGENFVNDAFIKIVIGIAFIVLSACPFLCFQGYFWNLTENIINRETDITSSDVYNGRIKEVYKIELPEIHTGKFIWRGIASIVATLLLCYPIIILVTLSFLGSGDILSFYQLDASSMTILYLCLFLFVGMFIPALLWNYARRDSIFAVWNLPKAIHIIGSYFGKYLWNTILFLCFAFLNFCITNLLTLILGFSASELSFNAEMFFNLKGIVLLFLEYSIAIYFIFVNAYLLGTIAPSSEG